MSKNVLILGGAGFLGINLCKALKKLNNYALACGDIVNPLIDGVEYIKMDLLDPLLQLEACINRFDFVINLTGQITNPIAPCLELNTIGIQKLVLIIKTLNTKLIQISTITLYGTVEFADENTPPNPETVYSSCKTFAEFIIRSNLPENQYCILRISNLYGENQKKGILSYLIASNHSDRKLHFNNNGNLIRYYLHINDCIKIITEVLMRFDKKIFGIYNVVGQDQFTIRSLILLFENLSDTSYEVEYNPVPPYDNTTNVSDARLHDFIPIKFKYNIAKTILSKIKVNH